MPMGSAVIYDAAKIYNPASNKVKSDAQYV